MEERAGAAGRAGELIYIFGSMGGGREESEHAGTGQRILGEGKKTRSQEKEEERQRSGLKREDRERERARKTKSSSGSRRRKKKKNRDDSVRLLPASQARTPLFLLLSTPGSGADVDLGLTGDRGDARPVGWEWEGVDDEERKKTMGEKIAERQKVERASPLLLRRSRRRRRRRPKKARRSNLPKKILLCFCALYVSARPPFPPRLGRLRSRT